MPVPDSQVRLAIEALETSNAEVERLKGERSDTVKNAARTSIREINKIIDDSLAAYSAANRLAHSDFNDGAIQALSKMKAKLDDVIKSRRLNGLELF